MSEIKKLYLVDVIHAVYVMAEDEAAAEKAAKRGIYEFGDDPLVIMKEVKGGPIPKSWVDSIPFGSEDDKTVGMIMAEKVAEARGKEGS